ncbi:serine/threonine-protein kinase [Leptolyngbya sp. FACHB-261]|uniref:serine/threonine-protein kinase n=1 Tax=Leptolyngbya sp. FACHB-261 TaxID=2692806 RepID=UPI00168930B8|nr:serine/threonine-protein kinase [Leptolyngbya sp. FACHB-261]MBD2101057.1 serine/threonine protein kinase [Leptolyngbya sp. FACHB-261]
MQGELLDGRYQITQVLSEGGFGQTYLAEDIRRPGRPICVVKHLKPASNDPAFLQTARRLFISEATVLEQLGSHDQIPRLLAYLEENQEFYLVQEFIQGHSLQAELKRGQRWTEGQVTHLLYEVLSVLGFVHGHGMIHRDIKPTNVLRRQQDSKLVLIDFGAVKQIQTQLTAPGQNSLTVAIGTPGYMPNEQAYGMPRSNSDIYALGMIAIQALIGLHPTRFEKDAQTGEILWQHQAEVSAELAAVITRMVHFYFKDRYQTAAEVLEVLRPLVRASPNLSSAFVQQEASQPLPMGSETDLFLPAEADRGSVPPVLSSVEPQSHSELSAQQYSQLEQIFTDLVGPIAPTVLRQVSAKAPGLQEVVDSLVMHLRPDQQREFQQRATSLFLEPKAQPQAQSRSQQLSIREATQQLSSFNNQASKDFINQCEQALAELVGPIATFLVRRALKSKPQISSTELVETLMAEIPEASRAEFRRQLLF